jgi:hypothetical protein
LFLQQDDIDQTNQPVMLNTIELTLEVGAEQFMNPDLIIAGGGPPGLAPAIALEAFPYLGVVSFVRSFPLDGIRFLGTCSNPQASFPHGVGLGTGAPFFTRSFSIMLKPMFGSSGTRPSVASRQNSVAAVKHDRNP